MSKRVWLWCLVLALLTGCGGGAIADKSARAGGTGETFSRSAPSADGIPASPGDIQSKSLDAPAPPAPPTTASAAPAPAHEEAAESGGTRSLEPREAPRQRPGLGTEWGESRVSRVHDVTFARADADNPFAVAQLFYNDRRGVEAQASFHARDVERRHDLSAAGGAISVAIHDGSGDALDAVHVADRTYVVGESGARYTVVLTNHTAHRFEAVATVDGLDVINGRDGSLQNRGYVLLPFATLEIDGFRQSQDAVAAFRFASVADSYAARTGKARNIGVIGVAFFTERGDDFSSSGWTNGELNRRETATPFPSDPRFAHPPR